MNNQSNNSTINHEYRAPASASGVTFVGYNALTGDMNMWESAIGEAVRAAGHGTLFWNLRGQPGTPANNNDALGDRQAVADARAVLASVQPQRPVHVGLSIGGLFAARAILAGVPADGLVFLNTLRAPGNRLEWIGAATECAYRHGGPALMRDMYAPLLFGDKWLRENRAAALTGSDYESQTDENLIVRLLHDARDADWDIPYESLDLPVLIVTGERDCVFRVPADIERLASQLPDATQISLDDVGHLLPVEAPERLAELLIDFAGTL